MSNYRQFREFAASVTRALPDLNSDTMQGWIGNPSGLKKVLHDALCPPATAKEAAPKPPVDPIIRVDRSIQPTFPDWVQKVLHPDLQTIGPVVYSIVRVEQWLHPDQQNGVTTGNVIYGHIKNANALKDQLGLADLLSIQAKGIGFFRQHFVGEVIFGWRSVVQSREGSFHVPYLVESGGGVVLDWVLLDGSFDSRHPALRFDL